TVTTTVTAEPIVDGAPSPSTAPVASPNSAGSASAVPHKRTPSGNWLTNTGSKSSPNASAAVTVKLSPRVRPTAITIVDSSHGTKIKTSDRVHSPTSDPPVLALGEGSNSGP